MPAEDRRNSGLNLLFLLAQAYYKILECVTPTASWCSALDLELNESYLWTITNLSNLLKNHEDLRDFPDTFEPLFSDLYPSTIRDVDWQDMVAPDVERFLSAVQRYVRSKGMYEPDESSPGRVFVEMFRSSIDTAIERAVSYNKRMREYARSAFGEASGMAAGATRRKRTHPKPQHKEDAGVSPHAKLTDATKFPTMTVPEVMALLHVSRSSVYRFLNEGRLDRPGLNKRPGKRSKTLVLTSSVQRMLQPEE